MSSESDQLRPKVGSRRLDFKAIVNAVWRPFALWAAAVILIAFVQRQPGVICVTPVAWLMACWVGLLCVSRSRSGEKGARLMEAALSGGIFGALQGLLFAAVVPLMGDIKPDERQKTLFLTLAMIIIGAIVSALLSLGVGAAQDRKRAVK